MTTPNQPDHSPTPWELGEEHEKTAHICDYNGRVVAETMRHDMQPFCDHRANALRIIRCVNGYANLVAQLDRTLDLLGTVCPTRNPCLRAGRAMVRQAEGTNDEDENGEG